MLFNKKYIIQLLATNRLGTMIKLIDENKNLWSENNIRFIFENCCSEPIGFRLIYCMIEHITMWNKYNYMPLYRFMMDNNYVYDNNNIDFVKNINREKYRKKYTNINCKYLDNMKFYINYMCKLCPLNNTIQTDFGRNHNITKYMLKDEIINTYDIILQLRLIDYYFFTKQSAINHIMSDEIRFKCPNLLSCTDNEKQEIKRYIPSSSFNYKTVFT
jgi:hypothetical protein